MAVLGYLGFGWFVSRLGWLLGFGGFGCLGLFLLLADLRSGGSDLLALVLRDLLFMVVEVFLCVYCFVGWVCL